jgi:hypothetical protein
MKIISSYDCRTYIFAVKSAKDTDYIIVYHHRLSKNPLRWAFIDNKRKKDIAAAAALEETGGRNEFRHPLKYASGEKGESGVFGFFDKLGLYYEISSLHFKYPRTIIIPTIKYIAKRVCIQSREMKRMTGGIAGFFIGAAAFLLLKQFVLSLSAGKKASVFWGIMQPLSWVLGLLLCAVLIPGQLHWAGAGVSGTLIICTAVSVLRGLRRMRKVCPDKPLGDIT